MCRCVSFHLRALSLCDHFQHAAKLPQALYNAALHLRLHPAAGTTLAARCFTRARSSAIDVCEFQVHDYNLSSFTTRLTPHSAQDPSRRFRIRTPLH